MYSLDLKDIPKEAQKDAIDFAVSSVSIEEMYYRPIRELSKGYKQRVGIALALIHRPDLLIMDEPSEGLDPNQRGEIRTLIKKLAKHHTVIVSTHVMQEVEAVCTRMIVLNRGRIVADGSPSTLAKKTTGTATIQLQLEGKDIEKKLQKLETATLVDMKKNRSGRFDIVVSKQKGREFQPELSRLVVKNNWIVWKLSESEVLLEDVFHELTKDS